MKTSGPILLRTERINAGPNVMVRLTTQLPSMTSICIQLIPALTASSRVSPSLEKSAVRMLGAISKSLPQCLGEPFTSQQFGCLYL